MGYGTLEYEMLAKSNPNTSFKGKKGGFKGKHDAKGKFLPRCKKEELEKMAEEKEKDPMVKYPQLPDNWVKQTITGEASYDETVKEISNQLKRTIVGAEFFNRKYFRYYLNFFLKTKFLILAPSASYQYWKT